METVVLILMILVCFSFVLKQTFQGWRTQFAVSVICLFFIGMSVPLAIEQSSTQIQQWLQNPALMLDTSVLLFIDVSLQVAFAIFAARLMTSGKEPKGMIRLYRFLRYFPGLLIFPVLFYILVQLIFLFIGVSFGLIGWGFGGAIAVGVPLAAWGVKWLLPEKELRLEMLFLVNLLIAIIGVVATVNGRTAVAGVADVSWAALGGVLAIAAAGIITGFIIRKIIIKRSINKN